MSLRDKAREIRENGAAARGDYSPHGVPLRMYNYWAKHSSNVPSRENFCHYWRVVGIWAPLMFLRNKVVEPLLDKAETWWTLGIAVVVVLIVAGILMPSFGLFELVVLGVTLGACALFALGAFVGSKLSKKWQDRVGLALSALVVVALFGVWTTMLALKIGWWVVPIYVLIAAIVAGLVFTVPLIGDWLSARRFAAEKAKDEYYNSLTIEQLDEIANKPEPEPSRFAKRLSAIARGIGDFAVLIAQVVRVNKWKICPIVDVTPPVKVEDLEHEWVL